MFGQKNLGQQIFYLKFFWTWIFFNQNYFGPNIQKTSMTTTTTTIKMGFDTIEINLVFSILPPNVSD